MSTEHRVRRELAAAIEERGLTLLDGWFGPPDKKREILSVLHAGRNLLLEGPVGSGKTMLAGMLASALPPIRLAGCDFNCLPGELACPQCRAGRVTGEEHELSGAERFVRVQGSPDLFPEDLAGDIDPTSALEHGALDARALRPGRLLRAHRRLCFLDEVNRLSERLQNLLLELLEEGAMTLGGYDIRFPVDTVVIATMNPAEYVGVGRISEALRDRFERVRIDYPAPDDEVSILLQSSRRDTPDNLPRKTAAEAIVKVAGGLRSVGDVEVPPSVRATRASYELALSHLALAGDGNWRAAVRNGLRTALRGRLVLAPTHPGADDPDAVIDELTERLPA